MKTAEAKSYLQWDRDKLVARIAELEAAIARKDRALDAWTLWEQWASDIGDPDARDDGTFLINEAIRLTEEARK